LNIQIQLRNGAGAFIAHLRPSDNDNALCTSRGVNNQEGWVSASTNVASDLLAPGNYFIRVSGILTNCTPGVENFRLDDSSTIIMGQ
jgi:hypothetical protein